MFDLHDNAAILPSGTGGSQVDQQLTGKRKGTSGHSSMDGSRLSSHGKLEPVPDGNVSEAQSGSWPDGRAILNKRVRPSTEGCADILEGF